MLSPTPRIRVRMTCWVSGKGKLERITGAYRSLVKSSISGMGRVRILSARASWRMFTALERPVEVHTSSNCKTV